MSAYYNEIEPYAAQWLRNLIAKGLIADGEVDTRSIVDVAPDDLRGFTQCHFFAGIGGWSHALRLAGWADDRPVWTGSCPCQPFSVAGKGAGIDDARHLWPHFHHLIASVRPPVVMGEQVAGKAGYGWFDGVRADLARENYASRGVDIPACAINAPHIRQRLYWVATDLENTSHNRAGGDAGAVGNGGRSTLDAGAKGLRQAHWQGGAGGSDARSVGDMADTDLSGAPRLGEQRGESQHQKESEGSGELRLGRSGFWSDHVWLAGADGKSRRSKPGLPLLAHGIPNRVGRLRAYGNAIVPPLAAEVIKAFMECEK